MWNNAGLRKVFVLVIFSIGVSGFNINEQPFREKIYVDVLKNITRVHNVLNGLLRSYKHLKDMYEAKAKPQNELSVEIEYNESPEKRGKNKLDFVNDPEFEPVTQMIPFDEFVDEKRDKSNENIDAKEHLESKSQENIIIDVNIEKELIKKLNKTVRDLKKTHLLSSNEDSNIETSINVLNNPESIVIGTPIRYPTDTPNIKNKRKGKRIRPILEVDFDLKTQILRDGFNNIPKVSYNKNREKDLNRSTELSTPYKFSLEQDISKGDIGKHHDNKTVLVVVANREQIDHLLNNDGYVSVYEKSEEEMLRSKQLERKILRKEYGSVCLKVAIRKCYKTLMKVKKSICSADYKCKSSFKKKFVSNSKKGCLAEFDYTQNTDKKPRRYREKGRKKNKEKKLNKDGNKNAIDTQEKIMPIKKRGKLDSTRMSSHINYNKLCLPGMKPEAKIIHKRTDSTIKTHLKNILRDRYEKECQRLSTDKCKRACKYAVTNTCDKKTCKRYDIKNFAHSCKHECKLSFRGGSDDDDDDDDDSDSDDSDYDNYDDEDDDGDGEGEGDDKDDDNNDNASLFNK